MTTALQTLSSGLCPWLKPVYAQLEATLERSQLGHAWLMAGPAGVGKINLALVLARRLLAQTGPRQELAASAAVAAVRDRHAPAERHPDLHWLYPEPDKETISIEQIRDTVAELTLTTHQGGAKVVIIEPAEAMTLAAANALLKTLEEPAGNSYLLLLAHQPGRLAATVRSRCQKVTLRPPARSALAEWLAVPLERVAEAARVAGDGPLHIAAEVMSSSININEIEKELTDLCEDRTDVQTVAQGWVKQGLDGRLLWLMRSLREEVLGRVARGDSTKVTVQGQSALHNGWRNLGSRALIEQYDRSEKLLNLLRSGLNVELALQALLSGFQMNRGRS